MKKIKKEWKIVKRKSQDWTGDVQSLYVTCFSISGYCETRYKIKFQYRVGKIDLMCYISSVNENNNKFLIESWGKFYGK